MLEADPERVCAEPEEGDLAERDISRVPGEEVPGSRERRVHQGEDADVHDPGRVDDERERDAGRRKRAAAHEARGGRAAHSVRSRSPKMPCGRTSSTASRTTKNENAAQVGEISTATTASVTPIRSAATTAPPRLPSPPSTTIESSREIRS